MGAGGKASRREIVKEHAYYGSMVQGQRCLGHAELFAIRGYWTA